MVLRASTGSYVWPRQAGQLLTRGYTWTRAWISSSSGTYSRGLRPIPHSVATPNPR